MFIKATLNNCKNITLDIDTSEVIANKADAQWTYKGNKGYMPMVGHIAQTGQIVAHQWLCLFYQPKVAIGYLYLQEYL
jgi:hypothetical protein